MKNSSPQGRIFQVEYASEAVKQGSVVVGIVSKTHAVLVALKVLLPPSTSQPLPTVAKMEFHFYSATQKSSPPTKRKSSPSTSTSVSRWQASPPTPASSPTS
jgi:hypothetical protein